VQSTGSLLGLDCGVSLSRKSFELSEWNGSRYELARIGGTYADLVSEFPPSWLIHDSETSDKGQ